MAVADLMRSTLRLTLHDGEDVMTGKPIYKYKSFNNVKSDANADELYAIAVAFAGLQERSLYNIERRDNSEIRQEG